MPKYEVRALWYAAKTIVIDAKSVKGAEEIAFRDINVGNDYVEDSFWVDEIKELPKERPLPARTERGKPTLLTTNELSSYLGVSKNQIEQWRHYKKGPPYMKLGEGQRGVPVRYALSDVKKWLEENTVTVEPISKLDFNEMEKTYLEEQSNET